MQVHIAKESLLGALQHVLRAVSANNPIGILTGIHVQAGQHGLTLTASNSSMTLQYRVPQGHPDMTVKQAGEIVVPARYFHDIIRKFEDGRVTIEQKDSLLLVLTSGYSRIKISGMDAAEFPAQAADPSVLRLRMNNAILKSAIRQVAAAASTSETRPVLTGVHLVHDLKGLYFVATDGVRLASRIVPMEKQGEVAASKGLIIPSRNLLEASRMLEDESAETELEIGQHHIRFRTGHMQLQSVLLDGVYPPITNVIPTNHLTELLLETNTFLHAVERATVFASESVIRMSVEANQLNVLSRTAEIGEVHEEVPLRHISGDPFRMALNGKYLIDLLRYMDSQYIRIKFTGPNSPILIHPADDNPTSALFLITPIRTTDT